MSGENVVNILQSVNQALADAMADDAKVVVLGEDVGDPEGGGVVGATQGLSTRFGETRCRSTPIAEQAIVGAAIGASLVGYRPVAEIMLMNFTAVAMDMMVNHAAKLRYMSGGQTSVPIVIRTMTGAGFSNGGQHSDYVEGWFAHTAGIKVVAPSTAADAYGLMRSCIDDPDPCLFIENIPTYWLPDTAAVPGSRVPLGQAKVTREGTDLTIIAYSRVAREALAAADELAKAGISAEVVDLRTISPWDKKTVLASVSKTGRAIVAHEALRHFGPGGEIASTISEELFSKLKAPVTRLGAPTAPVPFSKPLEEAFMVGSKDIVPAAKVLAAYK